MLVRKDFYQAIRKYHRLVGLFVAMHFIILSLSGLMLLFKAEMQHTNQSIKNKIDQIDQQEFAEKYNQAYQFLLDHYQNDKPLDMYPDESNSQIIQARLGINGVNKVHGAKIVNMDYKSGKEIKTTERPYTEFYDWLLTLHHQLFLGSNGQCYIGIVGIAFILMNITGLLMFLKRHSRKSFQKTRLITYSNIHQYLGVFCLCWGLIIAITGTLLAFNPIFTKNFQKNTLQLLAKKYQYQTKNQKQPDSTLNAVIHTAFKMRPNGVIWYIVFPGMERGIEDHYLVLVHGKGVFNQYINEYLIINSKSAQLTEVVHLPILMQLALMATPFHTANYGGIFLKIIWTLFALTTLSFIFLGIIIFYMRKKQLIHRKNQYMMQSIQ